MAYKIQLRKGYGSTFDLDGEFKMTALRWNPYMFCWLTDITYDGRTYRSLAIRGGYNILKQFSIPFTIYVVSSTDPTIDPINFGSITMYIVEKGDIIQAIKDSNILVNHA